jgi:hypothetical protein
MTRDDAIADMLSACSTSGIGSTIDVDGISLDAVKKNLSQEEALAFAGRQFAMDGLLVEGVRLTVDSRQLFYPPVIGGEMLVDGLRYDIKAVSRSGNKCRITLLRYLT